MSPLVRGHDAYTQVEIAENTLGAAWGDVPNGLAATGQEWKAVPIISETMTAEREFYPKSKEFGESGANPFVDPGRGFTKGQLVIQPRYNQEWFWNLIAQFMGNEVFVADRNLFAATVTGSNEHIYTFAPALSKGFAIRVWKGGATAAGYVQYFTGCMITRMVWEQPEDDLPRITLDILGKIPATPYVLVSASGPLSVVGMRNGATLITPIYMRPRDLSNQPPVSGAAYVSGTTHSFFGTGATRAQLNIRGFTLTVDRHLTYENAFATDPDNPEQPGVNESRDVTIEIRSLVEQNYLDPGKPYREFLDKTPSKVRIIYATPTGTDVAAGPPLTRFGIMLDMPAVTWEEARASISEPGAPPATFKGRATSALFENPSNTPVPSSDLRIHTVVKPADDGSLPWSVLI